MSQKSNKILFLFDIDGTLTEPREKISIDFEKYLLQLNTVSNIVLATGSDYTKVKEQLGSKLLNEIPYVFCCMGNELRKSRNYCVYSKQFKIPDLLKEKLNFMLKDTKFPFKTGNHFEYRPGMLNFSIVGRNANTQERQAYLNWDNEYGERKFISNFINNNFPELDALVGGSISIDIIPKGNDKSQVIDYIMNYLDLGEIQQIVFFGDRTDPGGNDYSIIKKAETCKKIVCHPVKGPHETFEILKNRYFSP